MASYSYFTDPWDEYAWVPPSPNTIDLGIRWDMPASSNCAKVIGPGGVGYACHWTPTMNATKILGDSPSGWHVSFPLYYVGGNVHVRWLTGPATNGTAINCSFDNLFNGYIGFYTGGLGGVLSAVSDRPLQYNKWQFLEFFCGGFWTCGTPAGSYRICLDGDTILSNTGGERTASPYIFPDYPGGCTPNVDCLCYQGYADRMDFNFGGGVQNSTGLFNIWNGNACAAGITIQWQQTLVPNAAACQE